MFSRTALPLRPERERLIRSLFEDYIEMYASRDERLTTRFSRNFSGYAGSSDILVTDRDEWIRITRLDFVQVPERIRIEMLALSLQDLADDVVAVTAFFHIHLPIPEHILARETARLVLIFRLEGDDWMIAHSGISIPFGLAADGEIYPMANLRERNRELEALVEQRTSALEEANRKLEALSNTDGLTGIANRRSFDQALTREWDRGQRAGTRLSLIMLDVDLFKHFNDQYGHLAGDTCLQAIARLLAQSGRRAGELVARYGGEEFVVLLPDTGLDDAKSIANRILDEIRALALPHTGVPAGIVTVSLGVASLTPSRNYLPEYLVEHADRALYRAKQAGRNRMDSASGQLTD
jgi:diguanylate cyclase (GGDEF)-like protein